MTTENKDLGSDKKEPIKRTPRSAEDITRGALSLPLQERVDLVKELKASIDKEVSDHQTSAAAAVKIASVLNDTPTAK